MHPDNLPNVLFSGVCLRERERDFVQFIYEAISFLSTLIIKRAKCNMYCKPNESRLLSIYVLFGVQVSSMQSELPVRGPVH